MSKAFTRESDEEHDEFPRLVVGTELPDGAKNYMTPDGAARLRGEFERLARTERPAAVAAGDVRALRAIDRRIAYLDGRMKALEVIDPATCAMDRVRFGATVTVRGEDGSTHRYRIVGFDEANAERGDVSWMSPIAKALLGAEVGDVVTVRSPRREEELEVTQIGVSVQ